MGVDDTDIHTLGKGEDAGVLRGHLEHHQAAGSQEAECMVGLHHLVAAAKAWFQLTALAALAEVRHPLISEQKETERDQRVSFQFKLEIQQQLTSLSLHTSRPCCANFRWIVEYQ